MSDQELQRTIEALAKVREEIGSDPEKAMAFLVEVGIVTESGDLTEPYQEERA